MASQTSRLGESLKPPRFPVCTHAPAPHQAQILLGIHTSSVISALLQTCCWHLEKLRHSPMLWIFVDYSFLSPSDCKNYWLREPVTIYTALLPLCTTRWLVMSTGVSFLFFHPFSVLLISCRPCLLPCFFFLSRSLPLEISIRARRWSAMSLRLWCDTLSQPVG